MLFRDNQWSGLLQSHENGLVGGHVIGCYREVAHGSASTNLQSTKGYADAWSRIQA